jgi:hypothetical protein
MLLLFLGKIKEVPHTAYFAYGIPRTVRLKFRYLIII